MSREVGEKWSERLRNFSLDLPGETTNFPKHVLSLLEKHFGFEKMLIFPYTYAAIDLDNRSRRDALRNFVTLNLNFKALKAYGDYIHKVDIFSPKHLSDSLKGRKVLFTEDVMSIENYKKTDYYKSMMPLGLDKQACLYLRWKKEMIGTICIFRSENESDFSDSERGLLEYLSDLISIHYVISLRSTSDVMSQNGFDIFFRGGRIGALMLNQQLTVLLANDLAMEYCNTYLRTFEKEQSQYMRSNYQLSDKYHVIQQVINWIGLDIIKASENIQHSSILNEFLFVYWPLILINIFGNVETRHLILIINKNKHLSIDFVELYETLTAREKEILNCIASGMKDEEICRSLHISINTFRTHITNVYRKFDVSSRIELMIQINKSVNKETGS